MRAAEARGPSTPEERAHFVTLVRKLERNPLGENADAARQWLQEWAAAVPDIRFQVCPDLLDPAFADGYPYSREIKMQVMLSGAVFTIEHPGGARDEVAVYTAGVEGALRAYTVLLQSRSNGRVAALDDLLAKRHRGELRDHVAKLSREHCKKSIARFIAAPVGATAGLLMALLVARWFSGPPGRALPWGTPSARASTRVAVVLRRIVLVCAAYYLIVGTALHFLEPEYDPRFFPMSHYVWGAYGWVMTTTFFFLGLALFTVAVGLRNTYPLSRSARIGTGLLVIGGLFICLAGVFKGFPLHDVAGAVGLPSVAMAVLVLSWSFRKEVGWQAIRLAAFLISVGMLAALLSVIFDVGMPGLQQRAFLFLLLLWLSMVAHRSVRVTAGLSQSSMHTPGTADDAGQTRERTSLKGNHDA